MSDATDATGKAPGAASIPGDLAPARPRARARRLRPNGSAVVMTLYLLFLMLPIYWLLNMSLKTNAEILGGFSLLPRNPTLANYETILTDPTWYMGYVNSLIYVVMNTAISLTVALPAAYAFSRYRFMGDKHLFFWLLTNRMAPPAVFALPFFQLYSSVGLFDTHIAVALAHCLFNVPLAVWILEGFMRGDAPRDRRDRLSRRLLLPALLRAHLHAADRQRHRRRRVLLLHVLLGGAAACRARSPPWTPSPSPRR